MADGRNGLSITNLSKTYPGQVALRAVDLHLAPGSVHALLGQNGSGKSTLIKVLAGYHQPDPGYVATIHGAPLALGSANAAHSAGLRFIHQDLGLVPDLDVIDNLALGQGYSRRGWLSHSVEAAAAQELLDRFGLDIDVELKVSALAPAERTVVAVARALRGGVSSSGVLVLDEPTATLSERETELLFDVVRNVCAQGTAVLYVTHRLSEVFDLADTVTVLRDGRRVMNGPVAETTPDDLIEHIAGRPLSQLYPEPPKPTADVALGVEGVSGLNVEDVTFDLHRGEILGIAGVTGSGRDTINRMIFGSTPMTTGKVTVGSQAFTSLTPSAAIAAGLAFLPADRRTLSAIPSLTVRENVTLPSLGKRSLGWLGIRAEQRDVQDWLHRLEVLPPEPEKKFSSLSGGNQQKAVLARWLKCGSTILLLDEPTQGVDVGGKEAIYLALGQAAESGAAVILASSDTEELAEVCDRVIVMRGGRIGAVLDTNGIGAEAIVAECLREDMGS